MSPSVQSGSYIASSCLLEAGEGSAIQAHGRTVFWHHNLEATGIPRPRLVCQGTYLGSHLHYYLMCGLPENLVSRVSLPGFDQREHDMIRTILPPTATSASLPLSRLSYRVVRPRYNALKSSFFATATKAARYRMCRKPGCPRLKILLRPSSNRKSRVAVRVPLALDQLTKSFS